MTDKLQRPESFEFALDFLGDPEASELRAYIEQLEARAALAEPVAEGPTDEELWQVGDEDFRANTWPTDAIRYARAVLARYSHQPAPPAAGEPSDEDCWQWYTYCPEEGLEMYSDREQAQSAAQSIMGSYEVAAHSDGWHEDMESASWGMLVPVEQAQVVERKTADPDSEFDEWVKYELKPARYGNQPAPVPVAEGTYFEFVISDADDQTQAGGIAPTYAQALSEGQRFLAHYQKDGPHTLELRRVEVLPPGALPLPSGGVE